MCSLPHGETNDYEVSTSSSSRHSEITQNDKHSRPSFLSFPRHLGNPRSYGLSRLHYWLPASPISWTLWYDAKPSIHQFQFITIEGKFARADNFCLDSLLTSSYLSHSPRSRTNFLVCYEASTYLAHSILNPLPSCNSAPFRLQICFFLISIFLKGWRI